MVPFSNNNSIADAVAVPNVTADFISEKFCKDGEFDEATARKFADELRARRETLQRQVHDTRYSERILRDVYSHRDALKNAHKQSTFGAGSIIQGMDKGVIPLADTVAQMIAQDAPIEQIRSTAEEFVRVYSPFEMPVSHNGSRECAQGIQPLKFLTLTLSFFPEPYCNRMEHKQSNLGGASQDDDGLVQKQERFQQQCSRSSQFGCGCATARGRSSKDP
jgi:hypothetical protein